MSLRSSPSSWVVGKRQLKTMESAQYFRCANFWIIWACLYKLVLYLDIKIVGLSRYIIHIILTLDLQHIGPLIWNDILSNIWIWVRLPILKLNSQVRIYQFDIFNNSGFNYSFAASSHIPHTPKPLISYILTPVPLIPYTPKPHNLHISLIS